MSRKTQSVEKGGRCIFNSHTQKKGHLLRCFAAIRKKKSLEIDIGILVSWQHTPSSCLPYKWIRVIDFSLPLHLPHVLQALHCTHTPSLLNTPLIHPPYSSSLFILLSCCWRWQWFTFWEIRKNTWQNLCLVVLFHVRTDY